MEQPLSSLHRLVWTALLAALIAVGAYIHFPIGPVPFSLQTFFVMLAGLILGPTYGALCLALYLAAGFIGLPVFSGGKAGIGTLLGPTGGYLIGFVICTVICGLATIKRDDQLKWLPGIVLCAAGALSVYVPGVIGLHLALDLDWGKAVGAGALPFLPGDALKVVMAVAAYRFLYAKGLAPN